MGSSVYPTPRHWTANTSSISLDTALSRAVALAVATPVRTLSSSVIQAVADLTSLTTSEAIYQVFLVQINFFNMKCVRVVDDVDVEFRQRPLPNAGVESKIHHMGRRNH